EGLLDPPPRPAPPRPIAAIDFREFFLGFDKKWMAGGVALACGAGSVSIRDLSESNGGGAAAAAAAGGGLPGGEEDEDEDENAKGGEFSWSAKEEDGVELVSPLVSRGGVGCGGRESRHPGWGFGYNGPDPRVGFEPHVWYDMRMATDYKRCSVFLSDIRVVALARGLSGLKSFFFEPVQEFRERDRMLRPHRYVEVRPNNTDVEVVLANAYICLPESQWDCYAYADGGRGGGGGGPAVVAHADLTLTQQWRGMPQTGPGSSLLSATALATSVFLAPLSDPSPPPAGEALSLVTPLLASIRLETVTAAPSWRRAGPAERWAGMQGGERTKAGRKLAAAAAAAAAAAESAPIPPRGAEPEAPDSSEKAAVAAADMHETEEPPRSRRRRLEGLVLNRSRRGGGGGGGG
ncbi:unnamed protein product, partial [Ectocarpus fasciculatus]